MRESLGDRILWGWLTVIMWLLVVATTVSIGWLIVLLVKQAIEALP